VIDLKKEVSIFESQIIEIVLGIPIISPTVRIKDEVII
jgi:hypothetical protein